MKSDLNIFPAIFTKKPIPSTKNLQSFRNIYGSREEPPSFLISVWSIDYLEVWDF